MGYHYTLLPASDLDHESVAFPALFLMSDVLARVSDEHFEVCRWRGQLSSAIPVPLMKLTPGGDPYSPARCA